MFEKIVWYMLVKLLKYYGDNYLDQWDKIQFKTDYGPVYVSISREAEYPDSFDKID